MPENNFEIRSREVQEVLGRPPAWIIRTGITIVFVVLCLFVFLSFILKFPDLVYADFKITEYEQTVGTSTINEAFLFGEISIDQADMRKVKEKQEVRINIEGYPKSQYGYLKGEIISISDSLDAVDRLLSAQVKVALDKDQQSNISLRVGMGGDALIVHKTDISIFQRISNSY